VSHDAIFEDVCQAQSIKGGIDGEFGLVDGQRPGNADLNRSAATLELSRDHEAARSHPIADTAMTAQVGRFSQRLAISQIRRGAHDCHPEIRTDADRDHVLFKLLAHPDSRIERRRYDVAKLMLDQDLDLGMRMAFGKDFQDWADHGFVGLARHREAHGTRRCVAIPIKFLKRTLYFAKRGSESFEKPRTSGGWRDTAAVTLKEANVEPPLQALYSIAERGNGETQPRSRMGKASCGCNCRKGSAVFRIIPANGRS
jgi:hypothetical protein